MSRMHETPRRFYARKKHLSMAVPSLILMLGLSLLGLQLSHIGRSVAASNVTTDYAMDWLANSFATSDSHVQGAARSIYVASDGTVYADAVWDENGKEIGVYKDGQSISKFADTSGYNGGDTGIATNGTYFFASTDGNTGVRRYNPDGSVATFPGGTHEGAVKNFSGTVKGVAANGSEVYVSVSGTIYVLDTNSMNEIRNFSVSNAGKLTVDKNNGTLWIVSGTIVKHYQTDGTDLGQQISGLGQPTGLTVDGSERLLVADAGQDYNIKIYTNINSSPSLDSTFGATGGIFAGSGSEIGTYRPLHFNYPSDVGVDGNGNIYVISAQPNLSGITTIESYTASGTQRWALFGLNFEGNGDIDPTSDGTDIYSGFHHFKFDYTKPAGQGWSYAGYTINPFKYPNDPRLGSGGADFATVRTIQGHRLLFSTFQNGGDVYVNRFNQATDGEVGIPVTTLSGFTGFYVDSNGNIWECNGTTISELPLQGFDSNGNPQWGTAQTTTAPSDWNEVNRLEYIAATDTMYLGGYTTAHPSSGDWGRVGKAISRYDNWSGSRSKRWEISPVLSGTAGSGEPKTMSVAGNYLFVGHFSFPLGPVQEAYDIDTGNKVNTFTQTTDVYAGNDVDSYYGVKAFQRSNGEYEILKDDYNAYKIVMYRWCPTGSCTQTGGTTPTPTPSPTPSGGGSLPSPWQTQDIGSVGQAGSASYSGGTFSVQGSGDDIWNSADAFRYVYQTLNGDGTIVAKVASIQNTDGWAKAGVMIRETLTTGSKHALMAITAGNGAAFQRRTTTGGSSDHTAGANVTAPYWVKLVRLGNTFTGYTSSDGTSWTQVGSVSITMNSNVFIGLAVTAHNNSALNSSTFSNVSVTTASSGGQLVTAINAGGSASGSFVADTDYNQGNQYTDSSSSITTSGVNNAAPQAVYQSCRWGSSFSYTIPNLTAGASYTVRLHWAELTFQAARARVFNVAINGSTVLSNFDVYATVGYKVAAVKEFTTTATSSGQIVISFTQGSVDNPFVSGIEVYTA